MSGTDYDLTPNLGLYKPIPNMDEDVWGDHLNINADILDTLLGAGGQPGPYLPLSGGQLSGFLLTAMGSSGAPGLMLGSNDTGFYRAGPNLFLNVGATANFTFTNAQNVSYAPLGLNNQKILNLADPTLATDAVNKRYADANYITPAAGDARWVNVTGDTMTGGLVAAGDIHSNGNLIADAAVFPSYGWAPDFVLTADGTYRYLQWAGGGWTDYWRISDGMRLWNGPAGQLMSLDGSSNLTAGSLAVAAYVHAGSGRVVSGPASAGGNPSFCCWDGSQQYACGMFLGGGVTLYFGNMDANGVYIAPWFGYFDSAGNFTAAGNVNGAYLNSTGGLGVAGDSVQHNIYCDGSLGMQFRGVYNSGVFYAFGWDGTALNYAINGGGQGQLYTLGQNDGRYIRRQNGNFMGYEAPPAGGLYHHGTDDGGTWFYCTVAFTSDERIKQNIKPSAVDALNLLRQIPIDEFEITADVVSWFRSGERHDKTAEPQHIDVGMIAQKLQKLIPRAVFVADQSRRPDNVRAVSPLPDDMLAINDQVFVPYLVRAVQQLADRIDAIEARH